jgi:F-type H+-transporting ATPase subunit a
MFALEVPPVSHLFNWPTIWGEGAWAINKVVLIFIAATILTLGFFIVASRKRALVPTGIQNVAEIAVDFVENGIIMQTMGPQGLWFTPFLLTTFTFILTLNLIGLLPFVQMPPNSKIALPMFMALVVWLIYNFMGIAKNGIGGYFKHIMFPPGVPWYVLPLMTPINLISDLLVRPFALMVRLFANMFAGHLILVSFGALGVGLFNASPLGKAVSILPALLLVALTGFELLVAFLQAYIFTILAAVFTSLAIGHPEGHDDHATADHH